jgi:alpha-ketoglutarate-dependent taurine dioxygenase
MFEVPHCRPALRGDSVCAGFDNEQEWSCTMSEAEASVTTTRDWPFEVKPLHPRFGCEIIGLPLADAVAPEMFAHVYEAFLDYQMILFRGVDLPPATQVAFARRFGEVQVHVMNQYHGYTDHPEIYKLTNMDEQGRPNGKHPDKGTLHWHTDGSWRTTRGLATMMYSEIVPGAGGQTEFADMYGAYEQLPAEWKERIAGLNAIHNLDFSRTRRHGHEPMTDKQKAEVPPVPHPIVRIHPETGRKAIFLGDHAESIEGMDYAEGRALIEELNAIIAPPELVYAHAWSPGECMVWDNRCLLHRATPFDTAKEIRVMRRCTTLGETPRAA